MVIAASTMRDAGCHTTHVRRADEGSPEFAEAEFCGVITH